MTAFADARSLSLAEPLRAEVCIVGGGAAGLTLASQLGQRGIDVLLLESGGESIDAATQALYECEQRGQPYFDLSASRLRYLGGTTNHWAGYCRDNDPIDYVGRPELGVLAWPLRHEELQPYVQRAALQLGLDPQDFELPRQLQRFDAEAHDLVDAGSPLLQSKVVLISPRKRMRETHAAKLAKDPHVRIVLHANVTHVQLEPGARAVSHLRVQTLTGRRFEVRARDYILATHAVENARLLLCSNDVLAAGIGNQSDMVGRFFMDHPGLQAGRMIPTERFSRFYGTESARDGAKIDIKLSEQALRRFGVLQYYCRFIPVYPPDPVQAAFGTLRAGFWRPADLQALQALETLLADVPASLRYVARRSGLAKRPRPLAYELEHRIEQAPNPDSRLVLSSQRDALGMQRPVFNWALRELDYRTFSVGRQLVADELTRLGMGRFEGPALDTATMHHDVTGRYHHMGTTRMAASARDGVVDGDCRVHGVDNLYVAGSSVFTTGGNSGPTMILIALALRLADHLGQRIKHNT